jgi:hypothetical protein
MPTDIIGDNSRGSTSHINGVTKLTSIVAYGKCASGGSNRGGAYAEAVNAYLPTPGGGWQWTTNPDFDGDTGVQQSPTWLCKAAETGNAADCVGFSCHSGGAQGAGDGFGNGGGGGGAGGPTSDGADGADAADGGTGGAGGGGSAGAGGDGGASGFDGGNGSDYGGGPGGAGDGGTVGSPGGAHLTISYDYGSIAITTQPPSTGTGGVALGTNPVVEMRDQDNVLDDSATSTLSVSLVTVSGSGSIGGDTSIAWSSGVGTGSITISGAGVFKLRFTDDMTGVSVDSNQITISAAAGFLPLLHAHEPLAMVYRGDQADTG